MPTDTAQSPRFDSCLYHLLSRMRKSVAVMADHEFQMLGLGSSQAYLLMLVLDEPGIHPKDVASRLGLDPSTVVRFVDRLELLRYVERRSEGRLVELHPTNEAISRKPEIAAAWARLKAGYERSLGKELSERICAGLRAGLAAMKDKPA